MTTILCREIRKVEGGYIVEAKRPDYSAPIGESLYHEVICLTLNDVMDVLKKCDPSVPTRKSDQQFSKEMTCAST